MTLKKLAKFLKDCSDKGVKIPDGLQIGISDFEKQVPEEYRDYLRVEYNDKDSEARVNIIRAQKDER